MAQELSAWRPSIGCMAVLAGVATLLLGLVLLVGNMDSHHVHLRYLRWKHGLGGDWRIALRYMNVDAGMRESFLGRPVDHLRARFPDLRPRDADDGVERPWGGARHFREHGLDGFWIGESGWFAVVEHGQVRDITVAPKG